MCIYIINEGIEVKSGRTAGDGRGERERERERREERGERGERGVLCILGVIKGFWYS